MDPVQRVIPVTGPESHRAWLQVYGGQYGSVKLEKNELHSTFQTRLFLEHKHVAGWAYHGEVGEESDLLQLFTGPRGCWPGDIAKLISTGETVLCISNNGQNVLDWVQIGSPGGGGQPAQKQIIFEVIPYQSSLTIDMSEDAPNKLRTNATGPIEFSITNINPDRDVLIYVYTGASPCAVSFPAQIRAQGKLPLSFAANTVSTVHFSATGTTIADIVVAYDTEVLT